MITLIEIAILISVAARLIHAAIDGHNFKRAQQACYNRPRDPHAQAALDFFDNADRVREQRQAQEAAAQAYRADHNARFPQETL